MKTNAMAVLGAVVALISTAAYAQPAQALKTRMENGKIRLHLGEEIVLDLTDPATPKLIEVKTATAEPGDAPKPPKNAARFTLYSMPMPNAEPGLALWVTSALNYPLRYHAQLVGWLPDGTAGTAPTTICPVRANLAALEHWPETFPALDIGDFSKTTRGDGACVE